MDAGVPVKRARRGYCDGPYQRGRQDIAILSDILGDEDHLGDMDFQGRRLTSRRCNCSSDGYQDRRRYLRAIMKDALLQAREGRLVYARQDAMNGEIKLTPREDLSGLRAEDRNHYRSRPRR